MLPFTLYYIWSRVNRYGYSFSCKHVFLFAFLRFHIIYEVESSHWLIFFLVFTYFSLLPFTLYYIWSRVNRYAYLFSCIHVFLFLSLHFHIVYEVFGSIGLFFFSYSRTFLFHASFSYIISSRVNRHAWSFSPIQLIDLSCFHFHITFEVQLIDLLILFQSITSLIFQRRRLPLWSSRFSVSWWWGWIFSMCPIQSFRFSCHHINREGNTRSFLQNISLFFTHSTLLLVGFSTIFHEWKLSISRFVDVLMAALNSFCLSLKIFVLFPP